MSYSRSSRGAYTSEQQHRPANIYGASVSSGTSVSINRPTTTSALDKSSILWKDFMFSVQKRKVIVKKLYDAGMGGTTSVPELKKLLLELRQATLTMIEDALEIEYKSRIASSNYNFQQNIRQGKLPPITSFKAMEDKADIFHLVDAITDVEMLFVVPNIRVMLPPNFPPKRNTFMLNRAIDDLAVINPPHPEGGNLEEELKVLELLRLKRASRALLRAEAQVLNRLPIELYDLDRLVVKMTDDMNLERMFRCVHAILDNDVDTGIGMIREQPELTALLSPIFNIEAHELLNRLNAFHGTVPLRVDVQVAVRQLLRECTFEHVDDYVAKFLLEWVELVLNASRAAVTSTSSSQQLASQPSVIHYTPEFRVSTTATGRNRLTPSLGTIVEVAFPPSPQMSPGKKVSTSTSPWKEPYSPTHQHHTPMMTEDDLISEVPSILPNGNKNKTIKTHEDIHPIELPRQKTINKSIGSAIDNLAEDATAQEVINELEAVQRATAEASLAKKQQKQMQVIQKLKQQHRVQRHNHKDSSDMSVQSDESSVVSLEGGEKKHKRLRSEVEKIIRELGVQTRNHLMETSSGNWDENEDGLGTMKFSDAQQLNSLRYEIKKLEQELLRRQVLDPRRFVLDPSVSTRDAAASMNMKSTFGGTTESNILGGSMTKARHGGGQQQDRIINMSALLLAEKTVTVPTKHDMITATLTISLDPSAATNVVGNSFSEGINKTYLVGCVSINKEDAYHHNLIPEDDNYQPDVLMSMTSTNNETNQQMLTWRRRKVMYADGQSVELGYVNISPLMVSLLTEQTIEEVVIAKKDRTRILQPVFIQLENMAKVNCFPSNYDLNKTSMEGGGEDGTAETDIELTEEERKRKAFLSTIQLNPQTIEAAQRWRLEANRVAFNNQFTEDKVLVDLTISRNEACNSLLIRCTPLAGLFHMKALGIGPVVIELSDEELEVLLINQRGFFLQALLQWKSLEGLAKWLANRVKIRRIPAALFDHNENHHSSSKNGLNLDLTQVGRLDDEESITSQVTYSARKNEDDIHGTHISSPTIMKNTTGDSSSPIKFIKFSKDGMDFNPNTLLILEVKLNRTVEISKLLLNHWRSRNVSKLVGLECEVRAAQELDMLQISITISIPSKRAYRQLLQDKKNNTATTTIPVTKKNKSDKPVEPKLMSFEEISDDEDDDANDFDDLVDPETGLPRAQQPTVHHLEHRLSRAELLSFGKAPTIDKMMVTMTQSNNAEHLEHHPENLLWNIFNRLSIVFHGSSNDPYKPETSARDPDSWELIFERRILKEVKNVSQTALMLTVTLVGVDISIEAEPLEGPMKQVKIEGKRVTEQELIELVHTNGLSLTLLNYTQRKDLAQIVLDKLKIVTDSNQPDGNYGVATDNDSKASKALEKQKYGKKASNKVVDNAASTTTTVKIDKKISRRLELDSFVETKMLKIIRKAGSVHSTGLGAMSLVNNNNSDSNNNNQNGKSPQKVMNNDPTNFQQFFEVEIGSVEIAPHHTLRDVRLLMKHELDMDDLPTQFRFMYKNAICSLKQEDLRLAWDCLPQAFIIEKQTEVMEMGTETDDIAEKRLILAAKNKLMKEIPDDSMYNGIKLLRGIRRAPGKLTPVPLPTLCIVQEGKKDVYLLNDARDLLIPGDIIRIGSVLGRDYVVIEVTYKYSHDQRFDYQRITIDPEFDLIHEPDFQKPYTGNYIYPKNGAAGWYRDPLTNSKKRILEERTTSFNMQYGRLLIIPSTSGRKNSTITGIPPDNLPPAVREAYDEYLHQQLNRAAPIFGAQQTQQQTTVVPMSKAAQSSANLLSKLDTMNVINEEDDDAQSKASHSTITTKVSLTSTNNHQNKKTKEITLPSYDRIFCDTWLWKCIASKEDQRPRWRQLYDDGSIPYIYEFPPSTEVTEDPVEIHFKIPVRHSFLEVLCTDSRVPTLTFHAQRVNEMRLFTMDYYTRMSFERMCQDWAPVYQRGIDRNKFIKLMRETTVFPDIKRQARVSQLDNLFAKLVKLSEYGIVAKYINYMGYCQILKQIAVIRFPPKRKDGAEGNTETITAAAPIAVTASTTMATNTDNDEKSQVSDDVSSIGTTENNGKLVSKPSTRNLKSTASKRNLKSSAAAEQRRRSSILPGNATTGSDSNNAGTSTTGNNSPAVVAVFDPDDPLNDVDADHLAWAYSKVIQDFIMSYSNWYIQPWKDAKVQAMKKAAIPYCAATRIQSYIRMFIWKRKYLFFLQQHIKLQANIRRRQAAARVRRIIAYLHEDWCLRMRYHYVTLINSYVRRFLKRCWYYRVIEALKKQQVMLMHARRIKYKKLRMAAKKTKIYSEAQKLNGVHVCISVTRKDARNYTKDFGVMIEVYVPMTQQKFQFILEESELREYMAIELGLTNGISSNENADTKSGGGGQIDARQLTQIGSVLTVGEILDVRNLKRLVASRLVVHRTNVGSGSTTVDLTAPNAVTAGNNDRKLRTRAGTKSKRVLPKSRSPLLLEAEYGHHPETDGDGAAQEHPESRDGNGEQNADSAMIMPEKSTKVPYKGGYPTVNFSKHALGQRGEKALTRGKRLGKELFVCKVFETVEEIAVQSYHQLTSKIFTCKMPMSQMKAWLIEEETDKLMLQELQKQREAELQVERALKLKEVQLQEEDRKRKQASVKSKKAMGAMKSTATTSNSRAPSSQGKRTRPNTQETLEMEETAVATTTTSAMEDILNGTNKAADAANKKKGKRLRKNEQEVNDDDDDIDVPPVRVKIIDNDDNRNIVITNKNGDDLTNIVANKNTNGTDNDNNAPPEEEEAWFYKPTLPKNKKRFHRWVLDHLAVDSRHGRFQVMFTCHLQQSRRKEMILLIQRQWRRGLVRPVIIQKLDRIMLKVHVSASDHTTYYINKNTGVSSWEKPKLLGNYDLPTFPSRRWEKIYYTKDGVVYEHFVNPYTGLYTHLHIDQAAKLIQGFIRKHILLKAIRMPLPHFVRAGALIKTAGNKYESTTTKTLATVINYALVSHVIDLEEERAKDLYREAVDLSEANPLVTRAYAFFLLGTCEPPLALNRERAIVLIKDAARKDPEHSKFQTAYYLFQFAVIRKPLEVRSLLNLALVQTFLYGLNYQAEKLFRRALALAPFNERVMSIWKYVQPRFPERFLLYNPQSRVHQLNIDNDHNTHSNANVNANKDHTGNARDRPMTIHGRKCRLNNRWAGWVFVDRDELQVSKQFANDSYWYNPADGTESLDKPDFDEQWLIRKHRSVYYGEQEGLQQYFDPLTSTYFEYHPLTDTYQA